MLGAAGSVSRCCGCAATCISGCASVPTAPPTFFIALVFQTVRKGTQVTEDEVDLFPDLLQFGK